MVFDHYAARLLADELSRRKKRNPSYSMRAFARDLDINASGLWEFMSHKRDLSLPLASKIAEQMTSTPSDYEKFLTSSQLNRHSAEGMEDDFFDLMSHWHYFAILNLTRKEDNRANPEWIAQQLAISYKDAHHALFQLEKMKLISIVDGKIVRNIQAFHKHTKIPFEVVRKHHRSLLTQAGLSILRDPFNMREMRALALPIDPRNIEKARDILLEARNKITKLLSETAQPTLYFLSYYLFPAYGKDYRCS